MCRACKRKYKSILLSRCARERGIALNLETATRIEHFRERDNIASAAPYNNTVDDDSSAVLYPELSGFAETSHFLGKQKHRVSHVSTFIAFVYDSDTTVAIASASRLFGGVSISDAF